MEYFLLISIFGLNLFIWRLPFTKLRMRIINTEKIASYSLTFIASVLVPYSVTLLVFYTFDLDLKILSNFFILLVLVMVSISIFRRL
jgi:hypothetical protein